MFPQKKETFGCFTHFSLANYYIYRKKAVYSRLIWFIDKNSTIIPQ